MGRDLTKPEDNDLSPLISSGHLITHGLNTPWKDFLRYIESSRYCTHSHIGTQVGNSSIRLTYRQLWSFYLYGWPVLFRRSLLEAPHYTLRCMAQATARYHAS